MDAVAHYIRTACDHPILSRDEEARLARRYRAGDQEAFERLVVHNQRLVYSLARKHFGTLPLADAIQEGNLGLLHAIRKFEPDRGFKLSTYATWWIRQYIERARGTDGVIRTPAHIVEQLERLARLEREELDDEEILARMEITAEKLELLRRTRRPALSLDQPLGDEEEGSLGATLSADDDHAQLVVEEDEATDAWLDVERAMRILTEKERFVIARRFGLGGGEEQTLDAIGRELGVTRERVRQIQYGAIDRLRRDLGVSLEQAA